jgi:uncharacterized protein (DUF433 family)
VEEDEAMSDHWWERVHSDPLVMSGTPLVKDVPVWQVMQTLAHTLAVDEVMRAYPHLTKDDLHAVLSYAAAAFHTTPH